MANPQVGFFCKSYALDFKHLRVMLASLAFHNPDRLPLVLSLPRRDIATFKTVFGAGVENLRLVADEDFCPFDLTAVDGWRAQQLCKLASWRVTGLDHYAVIDSDFYFIDDVRARDLTPPPGKTALLWGSTLRTVLEPEGGEALLAYIGGEAPQPDIFPPARAAPSPDFGLLHAVLPLAPDAMSLEARSGVIFEFFKAERWHCYQPGAIYARKKLRAFESVMRSGGLSLMDAIRIAPWEHNWYGEYVAAFHSAETAFRVSPVFHVAKAAAVERLRARGIDDVRLARRFKWVAMASRHLDVLRL